MNASPVTDASRGPGTAVAVGMFDGVHMGHRALLGQLRRLARERGLRPLAVTFANHPRGVTDPSGGAPGLLSDPADKERQLLELEGMEAALLPFTPELRRLTAAQFMRLLHDRHGARMLLLGYNNRLGSDGASLTLDDYRRIGRDNGIEVVQGAPWTLPGGQKVSSSAIRRALERGDMEQAAAMLGHPYTLSGPVVPGRQLGRQLGFPTANVAVDPQRQLPRPGVYAATATIEGGGEYPAVVNIGSRPTVEGREGAPVTVEAYLKDFHGDLYGRRLTLALHRYLRPERHFATLEGLREAIAQDAASLEGKQLNGKMEQQDVDEK